MDDDQSSWNQVYKYDRERFLQQHDEEVIQREKICDRMDIERERLDLMIIDVKLLKFKLLGLVAFLTIFMNIVARLIGPILKFFASQPAPPK